MIGTYGGKSVDDADTYFGNNKQAGKARGFPDNNVLKIFDPEKEKTSNVGYCVFVDIEHALDPSLAEVTSVNARDLLLLQPDCGEQALSLVETIIRSGPVVVVVDSGLRMKLKGWWSIVRLYADIGWYNIFDADKSLVDVSFCG
ncbi:hypothetical protein L1987_00387 [Smallanthus sonchifolius]|uniref:Uncharacterized protein n=1 Tax=Smallanthus sonchifolius TaxID=185202 RepID=A0ACB9K2B6_9ASTR|nr:hypothetical protein L1987_00387 [Smallanthus sonchifolius]